MFEFMNPFGVRTSERRTSIRRKTNQKNKWNYNKKINNSASSLPSGCVGWCFVTLDVSPLVNSCKK